MWGVKPGLATCKAALYPPKSLSGPFLIFSLFIYLFVCFWVTPGNAQGLLLVCTQELLLVELRGPYEILGIKPGSVVCQPLPAVLLLQPVFFFFQMSFYLFEGVDWATPDCAKGFLLVLHSGISPGASQGPYGMLVIEPR